MESASAAAGTWTAANQLMVQLTGLWATIALAAVGTAVICVIVEKTVRFRIDIVITYHQHKLLIF